MLVVAIKTIFEPLYQQILAETRRRLRPQFRDAVDFRRVNVDGEATGCAFIIPVELGDAAPEVGKKIAERIYEKLMDSGEF